MYRYFIFDMDGTLVDSTDGIIASLEEMERRLGLPALGRAKLRGAFQQPTYFSMQVKTIKLKNFRNYEQALIEPDAGVTVFTGQNAQGKTNIIEATLPARSMRGWGARASRRRRRTSPSSTDGGRWASRRR